MLDFAALWFPRLMFAAIALLTLYGALGIVVYGWRLVEIWRSKRRAR